MLIVFLPIFVANTKIIFGCNLGMLIKRVSFSKFAAPLRNANREDEFWQIIKLCGHIIC